MKHLLVLVCLIVTSASAKIALITGITGQDGSYLAEFLLEKGYEVHGTKRRSSALNMRHLKNIYNRCTFHDGDLSDFSCISNLIQKIKPDEIYNLSAQSQVKASFDLPGYTTDINAIEVLRILEAIRLLGFEKKVKFYQASSSEMFGKVQDVIQSEKTLFYPRSPYGVSKLYAYWITVNYRESYGIFACNGILFNHESPRRGELFVTRKITQAVARRAAGSDEVLMLGNLDVYRDWGYAKDYVESMWLMLQHENPDDYVIATGEAHSVREFVEYAFQEIGKTIVWHGSGIAECGIDSQTGAILVKIDPVYFRPTEVSYTCGDSSKAKKILGWQPQVNFKELVKILVHAEREELSIKNKEL